MTFRTEPAEERLEEVEEEDDEVDGVGVAGGRGVKLPPLPFPPAASVCGDMAEEERERTGQVDEESMARLLPSSAMATRWSWRWMGGRRRSSAGWKTDKSGSGEQAGQLDSIAWPRRVEAIYIGRGVGGSVEYLGWWSAGRRISKGTGRGRQHER